jgi:hypothetical protein
MRLLSEFGFVVLRRDALAAVTVGMWESPEAISKV